MVSQLIPFFTASVLLTISPGPDIIYVLVQSMAHGKKAGFITGLGLVTGIIFHTGLVAFGVSAIIKESNDLFLVIKFFGAFYLFYLAYKVYQSKEAIVINAKVGLGKQEWALFKKGFVMNVVNPKVTIFFLAFFPGFLWEPKGDTVWQFIILGILFMLQALLIFSVVALLAGRISAYLRNHSNSGKVLKWVQVVVFIFIGLFILF